VCDYTVLNLLSHVYILYLHSNEFVIFLNPMLQARGILSRALLLYIENVDTYRYIVFKEQRVRDILSRVLLLYIENIDTCRYILFKK